MPRKKPKLKDIDKCKHLVGKRNQLNPYKVVDGVAYCMECYKRLKGK